ncbi:MAG: TetR/AcrR family transcriptional regulator [Eubacteriaceae bacterium]
MKRESSRNKQNEIIDVATILFYEQGYKNTYLEQIAKRIGVTKQLIGYHFGTKFNLATKVINKYTEELKDKNALKVYNILKKSDLQVSTAVDMRILNMLYHEDQNARRFSLEVLPAIYLEPNPEVNLVKYSIHDRQYKLEIDHDTDELMMIAIVCQSSVHALQKAFYSNILNCTVEQYFDFSIRLLFKMMNIDNKRIEEIISESKKIMQKLDYKIEPYFKIS